MKRGKGIKMRIQSIVRMIYISLLCNVLIFFPKLTYGDMGPKPSLTIYLKNAPKEYYLNILYKPDKVKRRETDERLEEFIKLPLYQYHEEGWEICYIGDPNSYPGIVGGNDVRTGLRRHDWPRQYFSDGFKVIIQEGDGNILVSSLIKTGEYNAVVLLDYSTMKSQVIQGMQWGILGSKLELLKMLAMAMSFTIIVELLIGRLFWVKASRVIIAANIITQVMLHTGLIGLFYLGLGQWGSIAFVILEGLVIWIEYLIYKKYLTWEYTTNRLTVIKYYVVIANLMTMTIGALIQI